MGRLPILTYHGVNVAGNAYAHNDHVALASDLETIDRLGWRIVPLPRAIAHWNAGDSGWAGERAVAITFDDGTDFDWLDLPHPLHGVQRSLFNALADFRASRARAAHATAFVVVSREAREHIDRVGLAGRDWWTDAWWTAAVATGHAAIASHSWDHNHDLTVHLLPRARDTGTFRSIDRFELAEDEIARASAHLKRVVPNPGDRLFAYPYGESNDYLVRDYFPREHLRIGVDAAFGDDARPMTDGDERWRLPRYVFGRDWSSPAGLEALLRDAGAPSR
ncbi:MAG: polysaccharide deacetylase family protein [Betaproteobacteria bacterium]